MIPDRLHVVEDILLDMNPQSGDGHLPIEVLLKSAPHVIRPIRFVLPAIPGPRSPSMLRIGLFLYDWLGARRILPGAYITSDSL